MFAAGGLLKVSLAKSIANVQSNLLGQFRAAHFGAIGTRFLLIDGRKLREIDGPEEFYRSLKV